MINVTKTYLPNVERYKKYVDKIFDSGWITNNGKLVQELELKLKDYLGVKNILLVSNGTLALQIAYKALDLKGDIITTPFSFVATTSSQVWEGLSPVFSDIDRHTFNVDVTKIEEAITPKTTAISPVHVFGNGCEVNEIDKISKKYNLKVVYDAAHAFGVKYNGKSILTYGNISTLSFHATKIFHTIEGGALIINDDELYEKAKTMISFGINGPDNIEGLGINAKMNEFQAAMGLCVLEDLEEILSARGKVYERYLDELSKIKAIQLQTRNEKSSCNYSYFPVVFENEEKLIKIKKTLEQNNIIGRRYFYPSLDCLPYIKNSQMMPVSNDISKKILCLPMYDSLKPEEQENIIKIIKQCV